MAKNGRRGSAGMQRGDWLEAQARRRSWADPLPGLETIAKNERARFWHLVW